MVLVLYITVCLSVATAAEEYYEDLENVEESGENNFAVAIRPNS